jgi:transcriptional regulator with XRE-family HTH domain
VVLRALGKRIRELRAQRGWTQERLAEAATVDRSYLAGIEAGRRNPSVRNLLKIGNALGVRVRDFFERE